ncbi:MAG: molybdopterin-guanine dinucleotide biosynthesis protein B [Gammaproteobacteria bacterium]
MTPESHLLESVGGVPLLGVIATSGGGKTTLLTALIPHLSARGLRVGCIKHSHHDFDVDRPGKDSQRLRAAGATQVMLSGRGRWVLMTEHGDATDAPLDALLDAMDLASLDLVLVEGFRRTAISRLEVHRVEHALAPLCTSDTSVIALASDATPLPAVGIPVFALADLVAITAFVCEHVRRLHLRHGRATA